MGLCNKKMASKSTRKDKTRRAGPNEGASVAISSGRSGESVEARPASPAAARASPAQPSSIRPQPQSLLPLGLKSEIVRDADTQTETVIEESQVALDSLILKLKAVEDARQSEELTWSQKLQSCKKELSGTSKELEEARARLNEKITQHERELTNLKTTPPRCGTASSENILSYPPALEDPDYPLFYEMLIYRKETIEQQEAPLEVSSTRVDALVNGIDKLTMEGMRSLDVDSRAETTDGRSRVTPCTSQPYQWIVSLLAKFPKSNGAVYRGSGSIVRIGEPSRVVILTCASNLYSVENGGFASEVTVVPGRDGIGAPYGSYNVFPEDFRLAPEYLASEDATYNYAAIFLKANAVQKFGFGYAVLSDGHLSGRSAQTAGYPIDKPDGTMWLSGGVIAAVEESKFRFDNGAAQGSSGAPIWTWAKYNFVLVGIQHSGQGSQCCRIDQRMIERIHEWSKECN